MELERLIKLSRLTFTESERATLSSDMERLFSRAALIDDAEVGGLKPPETPSGTMREDVVVPSFSQDEILKNARHSERGFFAVRGKGMWK